MLYPSSTDDEAGFRALEPRCASAHSADSKRTVALLSEKLSECRENFLYSAVEWGLPNLVRCALAAGTAASARSVNALARPVLVQAACMGHSSVVKQLLEAGADVNLTDSQQSSALFTAAHEGHLDCIKLLLAAGANANISNDLGLTPLVACIVNKRTDCARALLPASDLSVTDRAGLTAFHFCVGTGSEDCFDLLLPLVDVDQRTVQCVNVPGDRVPNFGCSPLLLACHKGQHRMAKALLKRGADRVALNSSQQTPLFYAALEGHLACVVLLLGQPGKFKMTPAEVNAADVLGHTALHYACRNGHVNICGVLLEAGARLDVADLYGETPLMVAQLEQPTNAALLALLSGDGPAQPPGTVCDHCGKTAAQASAKALKACSQCHAVRYCGAACSVAAWPGHKKACKARAAEREEATKPTFVD